MPVDVREAFKRVAIQAGAVGEEEGRAEEWIKGLERAGRYQVEVW